MAKKRKSGGVVVDDNNDSNASAASAVPLRGSKVRVVAENTKIGIVVTPAATRDGAQRHQREGIHPRALFSAPAAAQAIPVTPFSHKKRRDDEVKTPGSTARRRLIFGRPVQPVHVQDSVRTVYNIVRKRTGSIGGNSSFGPIYGELTMGSMQKMVNLMKEHTGFSSRSRFIDVGSGIGKPNLHVTQDPGVEFSYGIEVEESRWLLGMNCLQGVLEAAQERPDEIRHRCLFVRGDITEAATFDPFTHVYMFSIGFPPQLWCELADRWNRSASPYLICYHGPKDIIAAYDFHVELVTQTQTSMHGSKEGHMGYIYRRTAGLCESPVVDNDDDDDNDTRCDPYFAKTWETVRSGLHAVKREVDAKVGERMTSGPSTRAHRSRS
jgi:hypothetical protein